MGNNIFIKNRRVYITPLQIRLEAIQKLKPPMTVEGCRRFMGMVNFLKYVLSLNYRNKGRFHLHSDTSKFATGSALYQIQNKKTQINSICK